MIPDWMNEKDTYVPPKKGGAYLYKTMRSMGLIMSRITIQTGSEGKINIPAKWKIIVLLLSIIAVSVTNNKTVLLFFAAATLLIIALKPPEVINKIVKNAFASGIIASIFLLPAFVTNPVGRMNNLLVLIKVMLSISLVSIFNHSTQWNHITRGLRCLHVPTVFVFILDITLKYIYVLGNFINEMLTAHVMRAVGKNKDKYGAIGGIMGVTFIRGNELNKAMYEAMVCRGFTDDYKGL